MHPGAREEKRPALPFDRRQGGQAGRCGRRYRLEQRIDKSHPARLHRNGHDEWNGEKHQRRQSQRFIHLDVFGARETDEKTAEAGQCRHHQEIAQRHRRFAAEQGHQEGGQAQSGDKQAELAEITPDNRQADGIAEFLPKSHGNRLVFPGPQSVSIDMERTRGRIFLPALYKKAENGIVR